MGATLLLPGGSRSPRPRGCAPYPAGQVRALASHRPPVTSPQRGRELDLDGVEFQVPHIVSTGSTGRWGALLSRSLPFLTPSCRVWGTWQPGKGGSWPLLCGGGGATVFSVVFGWSRAITLCKLSVLGGCLCFGPLVERAVFCWGFCPLEATDFLNFFFLAYRWLLHPAWEIWGKRKTQGAHSVLFFGSQGPSQSAFSPPFRVFLHLSVLYILSSVFSYS